MCPYFIIWIWKTLKRSIRSHPSGFAQRCNFNNIKLQTARELSSSDSLNDSFPHDRTLKWLLRAIKCFLWTAWLDKTRRKVILSCATPRYWVRKIKWNVECSNTSGKHNISPIEGHERARKQQRVGELPGGMYWQVPDEFTSTLVWKVASNLSSALRRKRSINSSSVCFYHERWYNTQHALRLHVFESL